MKRAITKIFFILITFAISACGPGQLFGPTITPSPTNTLTPTATPSPTATFTCTPTFTSSPTLSPTPEANRFFETATEVPFIFSYIHPDNWAKRHAVGNITGWRGPDRTTLSFQYLGSPYTSAQDAAKYWTILMFQGSEYEIISEGQFQTNVNQDAYKVAVKTIFDDGETRYAVEYYFVKNGFLINSGYSRIWAFHQNFDEMIDQLMATFRFEGF